MAVDELLLEQAVAGRMALRFYGWSEPTLSLGYFQAHADRDSHPPSRTCTLVRRRSGGGAILHDHEITYAFAMPIAARWGTDAAALVNTLHQATIRLLSNMGCQAELYDGTVTDEAFLCFCRRARGDVVAGDIKLMGSAQRRRKEALLQHGSLLLARSEYAPSLAGLWDLTPTACSTELATALANEMLAALDLEGHPNELSNSDIQRVEAINRKRFSAPQWTLRR